MNPSPPVVEQVDLDRAKEILGESMWSDLSEHNRNSLSLVQGLARHREAARINGMMEAVGIAEICAATERSYSDGNILAYNHAVRQIAAAIRSAAGGGAK